MDSRQYDLFVLELGCRANGAGSCYAVQQSGALDGLTAAFVRRCDETKCFLNY